MGAWSHHASCPGVAVTSVQDGVDRGGFGATGPVWIKNVYVPGNKPLYHIVVLYERMVHL